MKSWGRNHKWTLLISSLVLAVALVLSGYSGILPNLHVQAANQNPAQPSAPVAQESSGPAMPDQGTLAQLYENTLPSVVNIQVVQEASTNAIPNPFGLPGAPPQQQEGQGSGFIYDSDGHIVTNNHVVENATSITVNFSNGMWADAQVVATDPQADLAVIQVKAPDGMTLQPMQLAQSESLQVGNYVLALGSPFGLKGSMTLGIVSALDRSFAVGQSANANYSLPEVIQTDAAINPGNSGGPLINLNGEIVGVNFAINSPVRANSGVGFAIPVSIVEKVVPALIDQGSYDYPYLGIAGATIDAQVAQQADLPDNTLGVLVSSVVSGGPSDKAGLKEGDIITAIDSESVHSFEDLVSYLIDSTKPGDTVKLTVQRNGEEQTFDVELGQRPTGPVATQQQTEVTAGKAIDIAKAAVTKAGLLSSVQEVTVTNDTVEGQSVWVVKLTDGSQTATVVVDAHSGEVLEMTAGQ